VGVAVARREELRPLLLGVLAMATAFVLVSLPMIRWAVEHPDGYLGHTRYNTIFHQPSWRAERGLGARTAFLARRYVDYWDRVCCHPKVDGTDANGIVPPARVPFLVLALCGMVLGLLRHRGPPVTLAIVLIVVMPVASVLSEGGVARRAFVTLPFLALFAALGAVELVRAAERRRPAFRVPVAAALAVLLGLLAVQNLNDYFGKLPGSDAESFVFTRPMTDASLYMKSLPPDRHVYFYSVRASFNHEVREFLAPHDVGEDRSREFGGNYRFGVAHDGTVPVFIFMDGYRLDVTKAERRYPGGETVVGGPASNPEFVAYTAPG
jgi:hypothetical protein